VSQQETSLLREETSAYRDVEIWMTEVAVILGDFIFQDYVTPESIPSQVRQHPMILVSVIAIVSKYDFGLK
jgi:hypothetical protein